MSIVCDISAAAREGCRAKKGLPTLLRLRRRAHEALVSASRTNARSITTLSSLSSSVDDLSHLVSVAKLRRVAYSPPQKQASSGSDLSGMISWQGEAPFSPNSQESLATSATLAENLSYEPITGLAFDQPTFTGIVPPPPAPENVWYMPDSPQSVGNVSYGQLTDARGQGVSAMGMDTSTAYEYGFGSGNEESGVTNGMELNGDGGDGGMGFDFEAFVNQVGMGGMGLIG